MGVRKRSVKKKATAPKKVEDVNYVAENFIRSFQKAVSDSNTISSIILSELLLSKTDCGILPDHFSI